MNALPEIRHEPGADGGRFVIRDGERQLAECAYVIRGDHAVFHHTFVHPSLRGQAVGERLVEAGVAWARAAGVGIRPTCSYVVRLMQKRPELVVRPARGESSADR